MKKEKPLILLSNDDGVEAKGLNELIRGLRGMGEIIVMAPDGPRSGASGAITSEHPVKYYKVREEEDLTVYKCTGTPVDCVKLALHTVVPRRPDVVNLFYRRRSAAFTITSSRPIARIAK